MKFKNSITDIVALSSSLICAVHCAIVPTLLSFSYLNSLHFLDNPLIEWSFISLGFVFVLMSIWPSYLKIHQNATPLLFAIAGFSFIAFGRLNFSELWEIGNTVIGAFLVSVAHFLNWKIVQTKESHKC